MTGLTGSLALGLVWGWLLPLRAEPRRHPVATTQAILLSTAALAVEISLMVTIAAAVGFALTTAGGAIIGSRWRESLEG